MVLIRTPGYRNTVMIPKSLVVLGLTSLIKAQCPFANADTLAARAEGREGGSRTHLEEYETDDDDVYLTSDVGGPIEDQESLKAGERGPTLLEDFIFRQKITHFDHERVRNVPCCRSAITRCQSNPTSRYLKGRCTPAGRVLLAPLPAMAITPTSQPHHSWVGRARKHPSSFDSQLSLVLVAVPILRVMFMALQRDCKFRGAHAPADV